MEEDVPAEEVQNQEVSGDVKHETASIKNEDELHVIADHKLDKPKQPAQGSSEHQASSADNKMEEELPPSTTEQLQSEDHQADLLPSNDQPKEDNSAIPLEAPNESNKSEQEEGELVAEPANEPEKKDESNKQVIRLIYANLKVLIAVRPRGT